jgi:hypothetical protein
MPALCKLSDAKLAFVLALVVLGLVGGFLYFVHPGGFQEQGVWFVVLLPGALVAISLGDSVEKLLPHLGEIFFWTTLLSMSLAWYWMITYGLVKISGHPKPWTGF